MRVSVSVNGRQHDEDVEPRMLVVGNPARVMRGVLEDELLENQ